MRKSVANAWYKSIVSYEGYTDWLYFDTHKPPLATTGIGNMIDNGDNGLTEFGLSLPWRYDNADKTYATESEIRSEYKRLKALGIHDQGGFAYQEHAKLFLDEGVVKWLLNLKTDEFWSVLVKNFPDIEEWPADAQLAIMNMSWWMGPFFTQSWPNLTKFLKAQDFYNASKNCTTVNPSKRNPDNVHRFENAARVRYWGLNEETLYDSKTPQHPLGGDAKLTLDASLIREAKDNKVVIDVAYAQKMLHIKGFYNGPLDGLRGNDTNRALNNYARTIGLRSWTSNRENFTRLSRETIRIPVVE